MVKKGKEKAVIRASGKTLKIRSHFARASFAKQFLSPSRGIRGRTTAIFVFSVLIAVWPLPHTSAQSRKSTEEKRQGIKSDHARRLPYDNRPEVLLPRGSRGFHSVKKLLPPSAQTARSHVHPIDRGQPSGTCPPTITQSTSQAVVTNSVACSDPGIGTLESHYWRAFNMNTFTGGQAYDITSVEFGIEQALSLFGTDQPLIVNLYVNHGPAFPGGDWQSNLLASSGEIRVPNQEDTIFNVPLTATVPAGALELVMEVLSPDQTAEHNFFLIGSNTEPETGPSYLSAPDCGNPDPVATRCIGFPDMHYVFNVNGSCVGGGGTPTPTPTATPSCPPTVVTGSIDANDPTQTDRLNRGVISGCCGTTYSCQIFGDGQSHHYDAYTFTNSSGATQCITVGIDTECQDNNFIFAAAYLGTFDPNNICTNWIADEGQSPVPGNPTPFSFNIENNETFVLVISEVTANAGCPSYTMTVSGLCTNSSPTPTPTVTVTPTSTPTPTATQTPRPRPTPRLRPTPPPRPTR